MRKNKKMAMALAFCAGAMLFVTTAFADITAKTGYDQLKDAIKLTAGNAAESYQNFTFESTMTLRDNDKILITESSQQKYDIAKGALESKTVREYANGAKEKNYHYNAKGINIDYDSSNDTYYVNEYDFINTEPGDKEAGYKVFRNPFKEEEVKDLEKIFDALVGNLKNYVVVKDKTDGSKEFSGSLSEAQIPALVNAVSSFAYKQAFSHEQNVGGKLSFPGIVSDVFVKNVKGKAVVNKDGAIESVLATGVLSGKDKDGNVHDLTLEVLAKVLDVNATTVTKPDLKGKKVEKSVAKGPEQQGVSKKFVGTYKNDIIIEKNDSFLKIGERILVISHAGDKNVAGRYYEKYKKEYADEYGKNKKDFTFDAAITDGSPNNANFEYTNDSGMSETGNIYFDSMSGRISFWFNAGNKAFDGQFSRVFE